LTEAIKHSDVVTRHEALKSVIPGLPIYATNMTFVLFESANGTKLVLAANYIDPATIVVVTTINLRVDIFSVASTTEAQVTQVLKELGVVDFSVTVV